MLTVAVLGMMVAVEMVVMMVAKAVAARESHYNAKTNDKKNNLQY